MTRPATGAVVRAVRRAIRLRQADLAAQADMSAARLCRLERGLVTWRPDEIRRVATILGLPLRALGADRSGRGDSCGPGVSDA